MALVAKRVLLRLYGIFCDLDLMRVDSQGTRLKFCQSFARSAHAWSAQKMGRRRIFSTCVCAMQKLKEMMINKLSQSIHFVSCQLTIGKMCRRRRLTFYFIRILMLFAEQNLYKIKKTFNLNVPWHVTLWMLNIDIIGPLAQFEDVPKIQPLCSYSHYEPVAHWAFPKHAVSVSVALMQMRRREVGQGWGFGPEKLVATVPWALVTVDVSQWRGVHSLWQCSVNILEHYGCSGGSPEALYLNNIILYIDIYII